MKGKIFLWAFVIFLFFFLSFSYFIQNQLTRIYQNQESLLIKDRRGEEILILPNNKGYFAQYLKEIPPRFKELLLKKEDRYFYYHFGVNPVSLFKAGLAKLEISERRGCSTITQQLVKILLGNENKRTLKNQIIESFYAISLEIFKSKEDILKMYINSIYFGNKVQGIKGASKIYFDNSPELLTDFQILQLLSTISSPTENNPLFERNKELTVALAKNLKVDLSENNSLSRETIKENIKNYSQENLAFEIQPFLKDLKENQLTIDKYLSLKLREIVQRNIEELNNQKAKNAALIVIKLPENEILAMIGSPNPHSLVSGSQINMLFQPRAIGSTIKPFIYLKAFEKGLRPYTLVEDKEYKYITALGFPFYPKNFDWQYRGEVSLHYALSNSLNVPSVKVLEYLGLENFYQFLEKDLEFKPIQNLENYQLGIAMGALEMNLMDLAKYFTIFPQEGILKDLKIFKNEKQKEKKVIDKEYVQLVNKILSDRKTGIEQFGLKSELNLFQENYALKTGTSKDFKDSWILGFTPDFLVAVWVGNTENEPMEGITGQKGAGKIWAETMELLFNSEYNKKRQFDFSLLKEYNFNNQIEYGLPGDDYEKILNVLEDLDNSLILNPHEGDHFLVEEGSEIILKAKEVVDWFINDKFIGNGKEKFFLPEKEGFYQIEAKKGKFSEKIIIFISE